MYMYTCIYVVRKYTRIQLQSMIAAIGLGVKGNYPAHNLNPLTTSPNLYPQKPNPDPLVLPLTPPYPPLLP
jgi:hypothetical protein